ncbi:MAG: hypothetical protein QW424_00300 [Candidatus Bathyarchaeia archaeon]
MMIRVCQQFLNSLILCNASGHYPIVELTLSVPFGYEPNDGIRRLLAGFRDMVNFCIRKALEHNVTGFASLRKLVYKEWKNDGIT